jgi:hypothetical protein
MSPIPPLAGCAANRFPIDIYRSPACFVHSHTPRLQAAEQRPWFYPRKHPRKGLFIRYPVRQLQKTFEKIPFQSPEFLHLFVIFISAQGRCKGYNDNVYQFVPDIPVSRSPRIVYLFQIICHLRKVMYAYVPHHSLPRTSDGLVYHALPAAEK